MALPNGIALIVGIGAALLLGASLMMNQGSFDFAGPLRNWLWERDTRKMRAKGEYPETVSRSYWTGREHEKDVRRMAVLGYAVLSENVTEQYVTPPAVAAAWRRGQPPRRRVPHIHVIFEYRGPKV